MKQRRRIFPRFGLRSILVLTTVVAVVCGRWLVQAQRQRDAYRQLIAAGVRLDIEEPPAWFRWLPKKVLSYDGGHYFCPVTEAYLNGANVTLKHSPLIPLLAKLPRLKSLRIDRESLGGESLAGLARCGRLEDLDLSNGEFDDECLAQLPRLPLLKSLDLGDNEKCSKPNLQVPKLKELRLVHTRVNDETISQIAKLGQLQSLLINCTRITDAGFASLKRLKKLERLELDSTSIIGADIGEIRSLKWLSLSNTLLEDEHLAKICELPNLEMLDIHGCRGITDTSLASLSNNKTLHTLDISDCRRITQASVETISQISTLTQLHIQGTGITSLGKLQSLSELWSLSHSNEELEIEELLGFTGDLNFDNYDPRFSPNGWISRNNCETVSSAILADMAGRGDGKNSSEIALEGLVGLCAKHFVHFDPNVESLSLARSRFESDVLSVINAWPKLERLCLNGSSISNEDLEAIGQMTNLRSLELKRTAIDDQGLTRLFALEDLRELSLTDTQVTQASMPLISALPLLRKLELPFVPETERLLNLLANCPWLSEVYCCKADIVGSDRQYESELEEECALSIVSGRRGELKLGEVQLSAEHFERLLTLREFSSLRSSTVTDELCELIVSDPSIISLDLSGSPISDAGMKVLSSNQRWVSLDLTNTKVTPEGIRLLSKAPNRLEWLSCDCTSDSNKLDEALQDFKKLENIFFPISRLSRGDAREVLTYGSERQRSADGLLSRQLRLFDMDLNYTPINYDPINEAQIEWMLDRSAFDPGASQIHLLGQLIDDRKLKQFTPSANIEFASAIGVTCDPNSLIDKLAACSNLRALAIHRVPLSIETLSKLKNLKRLYRLQLTECGITDSHLPKLAELSHVVELILDSNQIQGEQLDCFFGAMQLDLLSLRNNPLTSNARHTAAQLAKQSRWLQVVR